jgi:hypothetical protein
MKRYLFLLCIVSAISNGKELPDINLNVNIYNTSANETTSCTVVPISQHSVKIEEKTEHASDATGSPAALFDCVWSYKKTVLCTVALSGYSLLVMKLVRTLRKSNTQGWAAWKHEVPLAVLAALPPDVVLQELLDAMYARYGNPDGGFAGAVIYAMLKDLEAEAAIYTNALHLYRLLERTKLSMIIPYTVTYRIQAEEKRARVQYLQELVEQMYSIRSFKAAGAAA